MAKKQEPKPAETPTQPTIVTVYEVMQRRASDMATKQGDKVNSLIKKFNDLAASNVTIVDLSFEGLSIEELGHLRDRIAEAGWKVGVQTAQKIITATLPKY